MRRSLTLIAACSAAALAAGGVALALGDGADERPLGADTGVIEQLLASSGSAPPDAVIEAVGGALPEAEADGARAILTDRDNTLYISTSARGAERVCLFVARDDPAGAWSSGMCTDRTHLGSGRIHAQLQDSPGGLEVSRRIYGIVPDDVARVSASWGASAPVRGGVYSLAREDALDGSSGQLSFAAATGEIVQVTLG